MRILEKGHVIAGRYRVIKCLGEGGTGVVYACRDLASNSDVAIKQLKLDDPQIAHQIRNEASIIARLKHRNIVRVYDFLEDASGSYFVLELVEGKTLDLWMSDRPFSIRDFLKIANQCLEGLSAAHRKDLLHLDIKPQNIMLVPFGPAPFLIKLLDFGLSEMTVNVGRLKKNSELYGTPYYIAPEQILRAKLSPATDLYSLGMTFYHLLSRFPPFDSESVTQICNSHLHDTPQPLSSINSNCSSTLESWIQRLTHREPAMRFQSCQEAISYLTDITIEHRHQRRTDAIKRVRTQNLGSRLKMMASQRKRRNHKRP